MDWRKRHIHLKKDPVSVQALIVSRNTPPVIRPAVLLAHKKALTLFPDTALAATQVAPSIFQDNQAFLLLIDHSGCLLTAGPFSDHSATFSTVPFKKGCKGSISFAEMLS